MCEGLTNLHFACEIIHSRHKTITKIKTKKKIYNRAPLLHHITLVNHHLEALMYTTAPPRTIMNMLFYYDVTFLA